MEKRCSLIILTGGRSRRFGSDKSEVEISGQTLLNRILLALPSEFAVIVVGPAVENLAREVLFTREDPIHGGPVAGLAAGLLLAQRELVAVLATDMPFALPLLLELLQNFPAQAQAFIPVDQNGFRQPLAAIYQRKALLGALESLGDPRDRSMRDLLAFLEVKEMKIEVDAPPQLLDIDTQEDLLQVMNLLENRNENLESGG